MKLLFYILYLTYLSSSFTLFLSIYTRVEFSGRNNNRRAKRRSLYSLSRVIPHSTPCSSPNPAVKRSFLAHLSPRHVEIFFSALDLSYVAALKFDCRPGLKFLVQKVGNLEQPANLYRQAAAAWTIKIITLFELCLREVEELRATLDLVKIILGTGGLSDRECVYDVKHRKLTKYLRQLRTTFDELCETYVEVVLDEDGRYTKADGFSERKIFLLVAQPDDFPEITSKEPIDDRVVTSTPALASALVQPRPPPPPPAEDSGVAHGPYQPNDEEDDQEDQDDMYNPNLDDESGLEELGAESENDPRPFRLSDLAAEYSTDSGPQSEPETDDSRPVSRLGSVTEKVVYPDRSGGTSSEDYIGGKFDSVTPAPPKTTRSRDDISYNLDSLWRTETDSTDTSRTSLVDVKADRSAYLEEARSRRRSHPRRRGSDVVLSLSVVKDLEDTDNSSLAESVDVRSRSVMDLRSALDWNASDFTREFREPEERREEAEDGAKSPKSSRILDNMDELLRDYEHSKRGFRTNPFLREDGDERSAAASQPDVSQEGEFRKRNVNKDSEAHRKAWADTLSTALEWALALPVSPPFYSFLLRTSCNLYLYTVLYK